MYLKKLSSHIYRKDTPVKEPRTHEAACTVITRGCLLNAVDTAEKKWSRVLHFSSSKSGVPFFVCKIFAPFF